METGSQRPEEVTAAKSIRTFIKSFINLSKMDQPMRLSFGLSPQKEKCRRKPINDSLSLLMFLSLSLSSSLFFSLKSIKSYIFLKCILLIFYREEGRGIESYCRNIDERDIDQPPPAHPPPRMCPQPMYMPLTGIEPGTPQFADRRSIH
uniref:Uncharacterized protein n=1 Tax=Pipistrellus kuhlii TaxID=59472 RepID=A0A7J7ZJC5_PIPKU|nr:hypothetical protein mPipKuh1_009374 [Pipistrellus kuhlii]